MAERFEGERARRAGWDAQREAMINAGVPPRPGPWTPPAEPNRDAALRMKVRRLVREWRADWQRWQCQLPIRRRGRDRMAQQFVVVDRALKALREVIERDDTVFGDRDPARRFLAALRREADQWRAHYYAPRTRGHVHPELRRYADSLDSSSRPRASKPTQAGGRRPAVWAVFVPLADEHGYAETARAIRRAVEALPPVEQEAFGLTRDQRSPVARESYIRARLRRHVKKIRR